MTASPYLTLKFHYSRHDFMIAYRSDGKQFLITRNRLAYHTLSNARETSRRKAAVQYLPASMSILILLTILCICSMIACLCRKPNWWLGIIFCLSIITESLGNRSFLSSFNRTSSKLINLYDSSKLCRFARLLDHGDLRFHWGEKKPYLSTAFQN